VALDVWSPALDEAYAKAQKAMPDAGERLTRALALVRAGAVEHAAQWGQYHYTVASESDPTGLRTYDVHAQAPLSCTCEAWTQQAKKGKGVSCKHLLATWLYRRALEQVMSTLTESATAPQTQHYTPENAAGCQSLPEAAFSLCLKGRLAGQDAQLTIRGATYAEFEANVAAVRGLLDPVASPAGSPAGAPAAAQPTSEAEVRYCPLHGTPLVQQTNERGSWWSHRLPDGGYCKGKQRKGA
jgi:hypothetical protein